MIRRYFRLLYVRDTLHTILVLCSLHAEHVPALASLPLKGQQTTPAKSKKYPTLGPYTKQSLYLITYASALIPICMVASALWNVAQDTRRRYRPHRYGFPHPLPSVIPQESKMKPLHPSSRQPHSCQQQMLSPKNTSRILYANPEINVDNNESWRKTVNIGKAIKDGEIRDVFRYFMVCKRATSSLKDVWKVIFPYLHFPTQEFLLPLETSLEHHYMAYLSNGNVALTKFASKRIMIYNPRDLSIFHIQIPQDPSTNTITAIAALPGNRVAIGLTDGHIHIWQGRTYEKTLISTNTQNSTYFGWMYMTATPDGRLIVLKTNINTQESYGESWNIVDKTYTTIVCSDFFNRAQGCRTIASLPEGLVVITENGTMYIIKSSRSEVLQEIPSKGIASIASYTHNKLVTSLHSDTAIVIRDLDTGHKQLLGYHKQASLTQGAPCIKYLVVATNPCHSTKVVSVRCANTCRKLIAGSTQQKHYCPDYT